MRAPKGLVGLVASGSFALAGCMVGPDYVGPPVVAPLAENGGSFVRQEALVASAAVPSEDWWTKLHDADLTRLIASAYADSPTLGAAEARIRQARASLAQNNAQLFPSASFNGAALKNQIGTEDLGSSLPLAGAANAGTAIPGHINFPLYDSSFDATWEIDFFGGTRRRVEQASAQAQAAVDRLADAQVQLAAEVGQAYVNLRDAQNRLALQKHSVQIEQETLALTRQRSSQGADSDVAVARLTTQLTTTESQIPAIQAEIDQALNRLAILIGEEPGAIDARLKKLRPVPLPPRLVPISSPADLLRRRPDIRAAERALAASNAMIGQSVARLFPRVTLLGNVGYLATSERVFGTPASFVYNVGPSLQWNILDFGRTIAQIHGSEAGFDESVANYRQAVLSALNDAETALSRFGHQRQTVVKLLEASASAEHAADLTRDRNKAGTVSLIDSLDVERQRLQTEQSLAQAQAQLTNDYISLQKALGLGWAERPPQPEIAQQ